ncbi:hypothetical protein HY990_06035 [Candidatus Micrarchaeota archaeon]|nr:hypothetical protein [Candidatus Micrarchaeota archaeon]
MNLRIFGFFFILFLSVFCFASPSITTVSYDNDTSAIKLGITIPAIESNATSDAEFSEFLSHRSLLVIGEGIDFSERMMLESSKLSQPFLAHLVETPEKNVGPMDLDDSKYSLIILIGGPYQNNLTRYLLEHKLFDQTQNVLGMKVQSGRISSKLVVLSISDAKGYSPTGSRTNINSSPLSAILPKEYIPPAATGISIILLALINILRTVFEFKALDFGRSGKKIGEGAKYFFGINLLEAAAIIGASIVLGLSISWQYLSPSMDFGKWLLINTVICLVGAVLHEITHRIFAHLFKIKLEYRFWLEGSILTLISSYLGNAFSVQAFILEEIPEHIDKWKVGITKLSAPLVSAIVMVVFAFLYTQNYDPIYQVVYSTSGLWAMAEMLPFSALDGKDIKEWNSTIWGIFFFLIGGAYLLVTFFI